MDTDETQPACARATRLGVRLLALMALSSSSFAMQGSETCAGAQPIVGTGLFAFDNLNATRDASDLGCDMTRDVWFNWSPNQTGNYILRTCGWTTVDTALAIYDGAACPTQVAIACDDDECGLQSEVVLSAVAGQPYLVRLGTAFLAPTGGDGFLEVAFAQCPFPVPGANVIAGDIEVPITYGSVGGTSSYSFATTACNLGDEELLWIGGGTNHPVLGHNLYRLEDGKFEQLGMSWLKHAFAANQRDLCCTCIASSSIDYLGVGCSDPYSAFTNGVQAALGPRGEVNAFTGDFSWPPGAQTGVPPASGILDRRLQVATSDINPALHPSATYYVEAVYAAPDDAAASNGFDNASYRPYTRTGATVQGAHVLAPAGVTERAVPALHAWSVASPSVLLAEVRLPGEGAFWVASDAIDEGGGTWRYEVAIFNLNSERGAAAVALPAGVGARDLSMSFPRAHSGDPRSNAQWNANVLGDFAVWSAPGYAVDSNANAILWGTTYSFTYRSDAPPTDGAASVVLFRGNGPSQISMPARVPRAPGAPVSSIVCNAEPNSGGTVGRMLPGAFDATAWTMGLTATGLPSSVIGLVIASRQPGFSPLAGGSSGNLCLGGSIGRSVGAFTQTSNAAGQFTVTADLFSIPQPNGTAQVLPGDTWYFQSWHRDVPGTSNFTTALGVTF